MISVPKKTLNNGAMIPVIGIGPGALVFNTWYSRKASLPKTLINKIHNKVSFEINKKKYINSIVNALNIGYRLIDYSFSYGNGELVTQAISKSNINRKDVFITSRVSNSQQYNHCVRDGFFKGLESMGLEYIDLYMFHWPVTDCYIDTYKELESLYKEGYVKAIGVANCHQHHLQKIFDECEIIPAINQIEVHPLFSQKELIAFCKKHSIEIESYTPLARNDDRLKSNKILKALSLKYNKTIQQIILRWHIQLGLIPIPRSQNPLRQFQNIDVFDFELTKEEIDSIDSININSRLRYDPDNLDFTSIG